MKNKILFALIGLSVVLAPAYAIDKMTVEPAAGGALLQQEQQFAGIVISGNGEIQAKPGMVFSEGNRDSGTVLPYLISHPKPLVYPRWAVRQGWTGKLVIAIEIKVDGTVGRTKVMQSSGHKMLDEAGDKAVKTWLFHPAMKNGQPFVTCIQIPILFQLDHE